MANKDTVEQLSKKDPRGFIRQDLIHLKAIFKRPVYTPNNTHAEILYREGQQSVIEYIENKMIDRRV